MGRRKKLIPADKTVDRPPTPLIDVDTNAAGDGFPNSTEVEAHPSRSSLPSVEMIGSTQEKGDGMADAVVIKRGRGRPRKIIAKPESDAARFFANISLKPSGKNQELTDSDAQPNKSADHAITIPVIEPHKTRAATAEVSNHTASLRRPGRPLGSTKQPKIKIEPIEEEIRDMPEYAFISKLEMPDILADMKSKCKSCCHLCTGKPHHVNIRQHFTQEHFNSGVSYKASWILLCKLSCCKGVDHYHCPICNARLKSKTLLSMHLSKCKWESKITPSKPSKPPPNSKSDPVKEQKGKELKTFMVKFDDASSNIQNITLVSMETERGDAKSQQENNDAEILKSNTEKDLLVHMKLVEATSADNNPNGTEETVLDTGVTLVENESPLLHVQAGAKTSELAVPEEVSMVTEADQEENTDATIVEESEGTSLSITKHVSIIQQKSEPRVVQCNDCCNAYHCPLCSFDMFKSHRHPDMVRQHINKIHLKKSLEFKGYHIMKCSLECQRDSGMSSMDRGHWHCPLCPQLKFHRSKLKTHIDKHMEGRNRSYRRVSSMLMPVGRPAREPAKDSEAIQRSTVTVTGEVTQETLLAGLTAEQHFAIQEEVNKDSGNVTILLLPDEEPESQGQKNLSTNEHSPPSKIQGATVVIDSSKPRERKETKEKQNTSEVFQVVAALVPAALFLDMPAPTSILMEHVARTTGVRPEMQEDGSFLLQGHWSQVKLARQILQTVSEACPDTSEETIELVAKTYSDLTCMSGESDVPADESQAVTDQLQATTGNPEHNLDNSGSAENMNDSPTGSDHNSENENDDSDEEYLPNKKKAKLKYGTGVASHPPKVKHIKVEPEENIGAPTDAHLDRDENTDAEMEIPQPEEETGGVPLSRKEHTCPFCGKYYRLRTTLLGHIASTKCPNRRLGNKCKGVVPPLLSAEMKRMSQVRDRRCPSVCKKKFSNIRDAKVHYALQVCKLGGTSGRKPRNPWGMKRNMETMMFHCKECAYKVALPSQLMGHIQRRHMEKSMTCELCSKAFATLHLLEGHMHVVHGNKVNCTVCGVDVKECYMKRHIAQHAKAEEPGEGPDLKCNQCGFTSNSSDVMRIHVAGAHHICKICGNTYSSRPLLRSHIRTDHSGNRPGEHLECPVCHKMMLRKNLKPHIDLIHRNVKKFECPNCHKMFGTKFVLDSHLMTHMKPEDRQYKLYCQYCNAGFHNKNIYKDHLNTHTGERPYKCDICNSSFKQKNVYSKHLEVHRNVKQVLLCGICNLPFNSRNSLVKHIRTHAKLQHSLPAVPQGNILYHYQCLCGETYENIELYRVHVITCPAVLSKMGNSEEVDVTSGSSKPIIIQNDRETIILMPHDAAAMDVAGEDAADDNTVYVIQSEDGVQNQVIQDNVPVIEMVDTAENTGIADENTIFVLSTPDGREVIIPQGEQVEGLTDTFTKDVSVVGGQSMDSKQMTIAEILKNMKIPIQKGNSPGLFNVNDTSTKGESVMVNQETVELGEVLEEVSVSPMDSSDVPVLEGEYQGISTAVKMEVGQVKTEAPESREFVLECEEQLDTVETDSRGGGEGDGSGFQCGYCQVLYTDLGDVHSHILQKHSEHLPPSTSGSTSSVELQLNYGDMKTSQTLPSQTEGPAGEASLIIASAAEVGTGEISEQTIDWEAIGKSVEEDNVVELIS